MTDPALIGALVAALAAATAATVAALRARGQADARIREAAGRFAAALGAGGELGDSLEPGEVARRVLDAVSALPEVNAALVEAMSETGMRTRAARGMSDEEAERLLVAVPAPTGALTPVHAVSSYRIDEARLGDGDLGFRAGLVAPLTSAEAEIGTLAVFSGSAEFPNETATALAELALRAGRALDNAHRFAEARLLADIDSLTGLQNRRRFHEHLVQEVSRAGRYGRNLALIVIDLDNFKAVNDRVGHLAGDAVLAEVAKQMQATVRTADIACRIGGDEFAVIMPESGIPEAEMLADRVAETVAEHSSRRGDPLRVSAGVAEIRAGDDAKVFFERADEALYRAKQAGKARTVTAP